MRLHDVLYVVTVCLIKIIHQIIVISKSLTHFKHTHSKQYYVDDVETYANRKNRTYWQSTKCIFHYVKMLTLIHNSMLLGQSTVEWHILLVTGLYDYSICTYALWFRAWIVDTLPTAHTLISYTHSLFSLRWKNQNHPPVILLKEARETKRQHKRACVIRL